jgi:S-(hydroxymethyl)glutathione dehydrogenase/alcohol dehydrogenase
VGLNVIQGAVLCGAAQIIAIDIAETKLDAALLFGATQAINAREQDPLEVISALTGGRGVDYAFAAAGSSRVIAQAPEMVRKGGMAVVVGMPPNEDALFRVNAHDLSYDRTIKGSIMGSTRLAVDVPRLVNLYQQGRLKLDELVTSRYRLEEINEAMAAVERGQALRNVIVFEGAVK